MKRVWAIISGLLVCREWSAPVKAVNFIKAATLNSEVFTALDPENSCRASLLLHTAERWLSRNKINPRVCKLTARFKHFSKDSKLILEATFAPFFFILLLFFITRDG